MFALVLRHRRFSTIVVALIGLTVLVLWGGPRFASGVAYYLYQDIDTPIDREAPLTPKLAVPTPDVRAVIAGRGEGLGCSIPWLVEKVFFDRASGESPARLQFRQACLFHDYCYRYGYATYGYAQSDCDFLLLQHAYRLCIQAYEIAQRSTEFCSDRARRVLLGVRFFGREAFQVRERSSFVEFDPMPDRADDFTVGRLVRFETGHELTVDNRRLISTPVTFRVSRGWLTRREFRWNDVKQLGENDATAEVNDRFVLGAVPTPPSIGRTSGADRYIWLARKAATNTGFVLMAGPMPDKFDQHLCGEIDKKITPCDPDASPMQIVQLPGPGGESIGVLTVSHRFRGPRRQGVALHAWTLDAASLDGAATGRPKATTVLLEDMFQRYRFLQSEALIGEFRKPGCTESLVFGRGVYLEEDGRSNEIKTKAGEGWERTVAAGLFPLTNDCPRAAAIPLPATEEDEPFVPVRPGRASGDRLLSTPVVGREVRLIEYDLTGPRPTRSEVPADTTPSGVALDASWLRSPAYVVRGGEKGDRLFFSRVVVEPDNLIDPAAVTEPKALRFEFRYFTSSPKGWAEQGYSSCEIDLDRQHMVNIASTGAGKKGLLSRYVTEWGTGTTEPVKLFGRLHKQEMARRWRMSQVIPGYIFESPLPEGERPLDVAVIFNGAPDYSILLQGIPGSEGQLQRLAVRKPSDSLRFARCENDPSW